ncbi:hypothetical protein IJJ46_00575 [Candidatus Saccharibacteria bacterium]|nr:hypothetical protein [Candidatus Saccharibacteria bacterium]
MKKALKLVTQGLTGIASAITLACGKIMSANVYAANAFATSGSESVAGEGATSVEQGAAAAHVEGMPTTLVGDNGFIRKLTSWVLLAVGTISVIMLIYGGFRYVISGGDSKKVTDAKNTILYAIIGLIISMLAYAIVNFIISAVTGMSGDQVTTL